MKTTLIIALCLFISFQAAAQIHRSINGFVRDKSNGESLPSANVMIKELKIGTVTNNEGYFVLPDLPAGAFSVQVSLLGYKTEMFQVDIKEPQSITHTIQNGKGEKQS